MEERMQAQSDQSSAPTNAPEEERERMEELSQGPETDMSAPEMSQIAEEMPEDDQPKKGFWARLFGG